MQAVHHLTDVLAGLLLVIVER
jgi:hypothetical protein